MKRLTVPLALFAAVLASAQQAPPADQTPPTAPPRREYKPLGFDFHLGYGFSPSFDANGSSHHLDGPEVGLAIPLGTFLNQGLAIEPSYFGGGRLAHGRDDDSDIYRVTLFLRHRFASNLRARLGVGYAVASRARGRTFGGESGVVGDLGFEIPFRFDLIRAVDPYVDVHGIVGARRELGGVFAGLGLRI